MPEQERPVLNDLAVSIHDYLIERCVTRTLVQTLHVHLVLGDAPSIQRRIANHIAAMQLRPPEHQMSPQDCRVLPMHYRNMAEELLRAQTYARMLALSLTPYPMTLARIYVAMQVWACTRPEFLALLRSIPYSALGGSSLLDDALTSIFSGSRNEAAWAVVRDVVRASGAFGTEPGLSQNVGTRLIDHFETARQHNTRPRLTFSRYGMTVWRMQDGSLVFSRIHPNPEQRTRLAMLGHDGVLRGGFPGRRILFTPEQMELVQRLCTNPAPTIGAEGQRSGTCCICRRTLTDPESVRLGVGPVCAGRWRLFGLPQPGAAPAAPARRVAELYDENDW